jgi:dihydrolipoamide dehydrogenase
MPQLLPGVDPEIAKKLESLLRKRGVKVMTATDASALKPEDFSRILVSVGRAPCAGVQGLEKAGVKVDKGRVLVDTYLRTNIPNIYAAGDCTGKTMLAHFAAYQGEIACENISHPANLQPSDNTAIPDCIFTCPEIASVGLSEEAARKKGLKVKVYKFDFLGSGMARILDEAEGFVKIVCAAEDGCVLGAGIIGPKATELIGILTPAVSCGLKAGDLRKVIFAHPTLSESISEALR